MFTYDLGKKTFKMVLCEFGILFWAEDEKSIL
jgi:hypothetical protein